MFDQFSSNPQENLLSTVSLAGLNSNLSPENTVIVPTSGLSMEQNLNQPVTVNPADSLLLSGIEGSDTTGAVTLVDNQSSDALTGEAMNIAKGKLIELAQAPDFIAKMNVPFGENWNSEVANTLKQNWLEGDFSFIPPIEIVAKGEIAGANGGFAQATDKIYLSQKFLRENGTNSQAVADVLLEEIGHSVDSKINVTDSPGDEGEIFAGIVQGDELSEVEIQRLQSEDDIGNVFFDGQVISIEKSLPFDSTKNWAIKAWNGDNAGNWSPVLFSGKEFLAFGSNTRKDGKKGFGRNWEYNSPSSKKGINQDNFKLEFWTKAKFEQGQTYNFNVKADDNYALRAYPVGTTNNNQIEYISDWSGDAFDGKTIQFTPKNSGQYWVVASYEEKANQAYFDLSWNKAFDYDNRWRINRYKYDGSQIKFLNWAYADNTIKSTGDKGYSRNWGANPPAPASVKNVPTDYVQLSLLTKADFEQGQTYEFKVKADDYYALRAIPANGVNSQELITTNGYEFDNINGQEAIPEWNWYSDAREGEKIIQFVPKQTGKYWIQANYREQTGDASLDISWKKGGNIDNSINQYFSNNNDWSNKSLEEKWDRIGGSSAQYGKYANFVDGDIWTEPIPSEVLNVYEKLSKTIFKTETSPLVNTGYAYDESYYPGDYPGDYLGSHSGIDIQTEKDTKPLYSATKGIVVFSRDYHLNPGDNYYGKWIAIDEQTGDGQRTGRRWWYGHLDPNVVVTVGKPVTAGEQIGVTGDGKGLRNHLHLTVVNTYGPNPTSWDEAFNGKTGQGYDADVAKILSQTVSPLHAYWKSINGIKE